MNLETTFSTRLQKAMPYVLIICGVIGFIASFLLTTDKLEILEDPNFIPPCNINPIISCGSVMETWQADLFGFPNSLIGITSFAIVTTVGVAMLAGAKLKRWFWLSLNVGLGLAVIFAHWLAFQTVYRIEALCLYCIVVWIVSIAAFWYITLYNFESENIPAQGKARVFVNFVQRNHVTVLALWYLIIIALILQHFWYYFGESFS